MNYLLLLFMFLMIAITIYYFLKLTSLRGEPQIYAEVASELQQRAHDLLVRKDHIEAHTQLDLAEENERWKNDLAQYMEDYEQEALARRRIHLGH
jgi:predicted Holliday junction resolvase-like endonuclease